MCMLHGVRVRQAGLGLCGGAVLRGGVIGDRHRRVWPLADGRQSV